MQRLKSWRTRVLQQDSNEKVDSDEFQDFAAGAYGYGNDESREVGSYGSYANPGETSTSRGIYGSEGGNYGGEDDVAGSDSPASDFGSNAHDLPSDSGPKSKAQMSKDGNPSESEKPTNGEDDAIVNINRNNKKNKTPPLLGSEDEDELATSDYSAAPSGNNDSDKMTTGADGTTSTETGSSEAQVEQKGGDEKVEAFIGDAGISVPLTSGPGTEAPGNTGDEIPGAQYENLDKSGDQTAGSGNVSDATEANDTATNSKDKEQGMTGNSQDGVSGINNATEPITKMGSKPSGATSSGVIGANGPSNGQPKDMDSPAGINKNTTSTSATGMSTTVGMQGSPTDLANTPSTNSSVSNEPSPDSNSAAPPDAFSPTGSTVNGEPTATGSEPFSDADSGSYGSDRQAAAGSQRSVRDGRAPGNTDNGTYGVSGGMDASGEYGGTARGVYGVQIDEVVSTPRDGPSSAPQNLPVAPPVIEEEMIPDVDPVAEWAPLTRAVPCEGASIPTHGKCAGLAGRDRIAVRAPCLNPNDLCMVKNPFHAQCVTSSRYRRKVQEGWSGEVLACPKIIA
jgi:hypothetical protein